jgi:UDP-N-acetylmuramyl pentapeptide synthase
MNDPILYRQAAETVAGEPVSIEPDGTIWADSDHRDIDETVVHAEYHRLMVEKEAAAATAAANAAAAIAHAKSLGFTDAMISAMYPALITQAP